MQTEKYIIQINKNAARLELLEAQINILKTYTKQQMIKTPALASNLLLRTI